MRDLETKRGKGTHQRGKGQRGRVSRAKGSEGNRKRRGRVSGVKGIGPGRKGRSKWNRTERVKGSGGTGIGSRALGKGYRHMDAMRVKTCGSHVDDKIVIT